MVAKRSRAYNQSYVALFYIFRFPFPSTSLDLISSLSRPHSQSSSPKSPSPKSPSSPLPQQHLRSQASSNVPEMPYKQIASPHSRNNLGVREIDTNSVTVPCADCRIRRSLSISLLPLPFKLQLSFHGVPYPPISHLPSPISHLLHLPHPFHPFHANSHSCTSATNPLILCIFIWISRVCEKGLWRGDDGWMMGGWEGVWEVIGDRGEVGMF